MTRRILLFMLCLASAFGQRSLTVVPIKRALVIGNSRYSKKPLINPVNDATDIAAAFRGLGFEVELLLDTNLESLDAAITQFASRLQAGDVALFYYSGHGMEVRGENYLLPVNFDAQFESQVKFKAYSANQVLGLMQERGVRVSMMILDACRDNPYRSWRSSGASGGLAGMNGEGAFIAFATAPGHVADDNPRERNGRFTKHLLVTLREPGLALDQLFNRVRERVLEDSRGSQRPFTTTGLAGEFYFRPVASPAGGADAVQARFEIARSTWEEIRKSGNRTQIAAFAREFSDTPYGSAARVVLEGMGTQPRVGADPNIESIFSQGKTHFYAKKTAEARPLLRKAAEGGHREAMFFLGRSYDATAPEVSGVATDNVEAVSWYRKAAELGEAWAMNNLGYMYQHGDGGLKPDAATAVSWYRKAAELGNTLAMTNLGVMYERGEGVKADAAMAVSWYRKAAELGEASGMTNLGFMYEIGKGVKPDAATAVSWYRKAAELGEATGMTNLGIMYERGDGGLKQDQSAAISWYRKAAQKGSQGAKDNLRRLGAQE
jgi:TPR repeat protein